HVIVMGHSSCGGVKGCHDMCSGAAPELEKKSSFVGRWMDILRPGYERVKDIKDPIERTAALEKEAVVVSLENLMKFPFVASEVKEGRLSLHGLWHDIGEGTLEHYLPEKGTFEKV
ncbi:MAG TPA: carbonic anhydrase, partial [Roseovarius nubinhibens]|nr:carbonic anhydrase [Roseovarius nubinhibens]